MRIDRPDYGSADNPAAKRAEIPEDLPEKNREAEEAERAACYTELRAAVAREYGEAAVRHDDADSAWSVEAPRLAAEWVDHSRRWPAQESEAPAADDQPPEDSPGSWRGAGRYLDASANRTVEQCCDRIRETEENVLSPAMLRIEKMDPDRELVGFEYRLKGQDRIKEKVSEDVLYKGQAPEEALANVKDSVRYTFQYPEDSYGQGVSDDLARLKAAGFLEVEVRNTWSSDYYRGINSRWREPETGQLFEVQFHTRTSFEAKQLTHAAYERIRRPDTSDAERGELDAFQRLVCSEIPVPAGAEVIGDYHAKGKHA